MYLLYFALWIIFNERITPEVCLFGVVIAGALFWFTCRFMDYSIGKEKQVYGKSIRFIRYAVTLVKEIIKANFAVIHMILSEREELEPVLVHFHSDMKTTTGKALLANAITLTPGTITVTLEGDEYTVHCLDESLAEGMEDSVFVKLLSGMEQQ